MQKLTTRTDNN